MMPTFVWRGGRACPNHSIGLRMDAIPFRLTRLEWPVIAAAIGSNGQQPAAGAKRVVNA